MVTGTASLAGTIQGTLINGFVPAPGDAFPVLTAGSVSGAFGMNALQNPGPGRRFGTLFSPTNVLLQVQTVPPLEFGFATTGGEGFMAPASVALDAAGNRYVVGEFNGSVDFDREHVVSGDTLTSTVSTDSRPSTTPRAN